MFRQTADSGETITCHKGCSLCCVLYVEASIKECEAIVYYLYQNESALSVFLQQYPKWRERIREYGDLFKRCEQTLHQKRGVGDSKETSRALADALLFYKMQNISCPFLHNNICLIHEVRPYLCAAHYVTTPAEWCSPLNPRQPKVYKATLGDEMFDLSFYHKRLSGPVFSFMPVTVYEILKGGFLYLSDITGLESLEEEVMNDPEVRAILLESSKP